MADAGYPFDTSVAHPARGIRQFLDIGTGIPAAGAQRYNQNVATKQTRRSREQTTAFLDGLEIVEPGVAQCHRWHPDPGTDLSRDVSGWGAVGRKP